MKCICGEWIEGNVILIEIDGKRYTRTVRCRRGCGLYVMVDNRMYFEYEDKS